MKKRTRSSDVTAGFSLLEVLVVVLIIGVLFAIAAPGWDTFLSHQRLSTAQNQITQVLRKAQSEARTSRSPRIVAFGIPGATGKPSAAIVGLPPKPDGADTNTISLPLGADSLGNWKALADDAPNGAIDLTTKNTLNNSNQIVFDSTGAIALAPVVNGVQLDTNPIYITVSRGGSTATGSRRCVVIDTLLGSPHLREGDLCQI
jgi:prepilin-type N-terminal cleavage/methylation domain-containing protein